MKLRSGWLSIALLCAGATVICAQPQGANDSGVVIRTETRQVLVDAVVTDRKGYVGDLKAKDFKIYEDNKEQPVKSFSWEADPTSPAFSQKHYLVLLYDQCHITFSDQAQARDAALKFVSANSGNNRPMSVITFFGGMKMIQDFTEDTDKITNSVKSLISPGVGGDAAVCSGDIVRYFFDGLTDLAKSLSSIPGRKSVVMVSEGFPLSDVGHSEGVAAVNALNKANVAVYPIDIRGVSTLGLGMPSPPHAQAAPPPSGIQALLQTVAYRPDSGMAFAPQRGGGGAPAGGARGGGGAPAAGGGARGPAPAPAPAPGGGRGPAPAAGGRGGGPVGPGGPAGYGGRGPAGRGPVMPITTIPQNMGLQGSMHNLVPPLPVTATDNQQVMYLLAQGTGGFVLADNDILGAMLKISKEQNQYYLLGYTPPDDELGACHSIKVKVDRGGVEVRSRTGYCNVKPKDVLTGTPAEQTLEAKASATQAGNIPATLQVPYFYTARNVARVQVAMDITPAAIKFEKVKEKDKESGKEENKLHAEVNVLGIATTQQGAVAARFSDVVKLDFDNEGEVKKFQGEPMHYENQFDIASGNYNLKVVFNSGGDQFGKLEAPLAVDPYDPKDFALSGLALSQESYPVAEAGLNLDAMALEDKRPMVAGGLQFVPAGTNKFKKTAHSTVYFEIYEPQLEKPTADTWVGIRLVVLDAAGAIKNDSGGIKLNLPSQGQGDTIARGYSVPVDKLEPGTYRVVVSAADNANKMAQRQVELTVE